jgi:hypothetical protein
MDWYVTTGVGAKPIGPIPEEQVIEMIRGGMAVAAVHEKGDGEWLAPEAHPVFAEARRGQRAPAVTTARPKRAHWTAYMTAIAAILSVLLIAGGLFAMVRLAEMARAQQETHLRSRLG